MEDFKISQLTKELVTARLKTMGDPSAAAGDIVKQTLQVALKGTKQGDSAFLDPIRDVCQGGMTGLLIAEQSLPRGAVRILEVVAELSTEFSLDPTRAMQ